MKSNRKKNSPKTSGKRGSARSPKRSPKSCASNKYSANKRSNNWWRNSEKEMIDDFPGSLRIPVPRLLKRYNSSVRSSKRSSAKSVFNQFFDKIFVINLKDAKDRLRKVSKQYKDKDIKFDVYNAIDGRCDTINDCNDKQRMLYTRYGVMYGNRIKSPKERLPVSSLTLAQRLIYIEMIKRDWQRVLISEDDVWLSPNIEELFYNAIRQLPEDWDMLYLGCGGECGLKGLGYEKTGENKYITRLATSHRRWYVSEPDDVITPCKTCKVLSPELSLPEHPEGSWNFAVSNKGARKLLKIIGNRVGEYCDKIYPEAIRSGEIIAYALDPPIVYHDSKR